ncbi:MAG: HesA/MoeB/ThiF family protein, partial [Pseudomonadota bacterium]
LSNLQRQIIHNGEAIGQPKVHSAASVLSSINDTVQIVPVANRMSRDNATDLLADADVVVDGSDSFETRQVIAEVCEQVQAPMVTAAVSVWDGSLTVIAPHMSLADGRLAPSFGDIYPAAPEPGSLPTCAEAGVVGALTGTMGTMQAMEVVKLITGAGEPLIGRVLLVDALTMRFETLEV